MQKRVTLSIISTTSAPPSRKYSAMRVATNAARRRTSAGWSEVATIDDGAGEALGAEVVLDELADLAAALADQRDDRHLGLGAAGDHRQQAGLADAGAGEDAEALAAAAGDEGVHGAHAQRAAGGRRGRAAAGAAPRRPA